MTHIKSKFKNDQLLKTQVTKSILWSDMADKKLLPEDSRIHGKNIYGTVDQSSTRIFHFWLMMRMMMMKAARLYIRGNI